MDRTRAHRGSVIVVDPRTGEILAMANRSRDEDVRAAQARNYAIVDQFEPGSTFKLVTLAGLYEEGRTAPSDSLFCENGSWTWNGRTGSGAMAKPGRYKVVVSATSRFGTTRWTRYVTVETH